MPISNQDLRKAGLKVTLPRIKILELLENSRQHHLSAEDIYKTLLEQGEDVGLATVYRVLTQFEAAGIIQRHHFENNHSVFEIMQEDHHDHLVCLNCNKVVEFTNDIIEKEKKAKEMQRLKFGPDGELFQMRTKLLKPIQEKIATAVSEIAKGKFIDFVFDKSSESTMMIYASTSYDLSNDVIIKLGYKPETTIK